MDPDKTIEECLSRAIGKNLFTEEKKEEILTVVKSGKNTISETLEPSQNVMVEALIMDYKELKNPTPKRQGQKADYGQVLRMDYDEEFQGVHDFSPVEESDDFL